VTDPIVEKPAVEATPATPEQAPDIEPEKFDPERAMETIKAQRESEKLLKAQVKELAARAKRADELEAAEAKRKEAEMSETERLQKQLADTEAKLKAKEHAELQRAVADKVGLSPVFATRLQGETEEELEADAQKILEALPKAPKTGTPSPTNPGNTATQGETVAQQRSRLNGSGPNPFDDPSIAARLGGGAFVTQK
jgi:hypothetical protein